MQWTAEQETALKAISQWNGSSPIFRLFGYAGTGKTTIAKAIVDNHKGNVRLATFTGKAAHILAQKTKQPVTTLHQLIYRFDGIKNGDLTFQLNEESPLTSASLLIIDECSMVDETLGNDLLSFGVPILVLGDPAQLPPITSAGFFTNQSPDIMLKEIHRQAAENPIIYLSFLIRSGGILPIEDWGKVKVLKRDDWSAKDIHKADQILVGKNTTRHAWNLKIRSQLHGHKTPYPQDNDKIICLKNNHQKGFLNGSLWTINTASGAKLAITSIDNPKQKDTIRVLPEFWTGEEDQLDWRARRNYDEFTYGYCITVHKSQGSQWDNVFLLDQSKTFGKMRNRWLYTGITRAAEELTIGKL